MENLMLRVPSEIKSFIRREAFQRTENKQENATQNAVCIELLERAIALLKKDRQAQTSLVEN